MASRQIRSGRWLKKLAAATFCTAIVHLPALDLAQAQTEGVAPLKVIGTLSPLPNHPARVALDESGTLLAVGNILSQTVRIYDLPSLALVRQLDRPGSVEALSFSSDKKLGVGHSFSRLAPARNSIRIWRLQGGEPFFEPAGLVDGSGPENDVTALDFEPSRDRMVVALKSRHPKRECCYLFVLGIDSPPQGFGEAMAYAVRFSPTGETISEGGFGGVRMWTNNGQHLVWTTQPLKPSASAPAPPVGSIAFSPDGTRILAGQAYGPLPRAILLDAKTGNIVASLDLKMPSGRVLTGFSPSGRWMLVGTGSRLYVFNANTFNLAQIADLPSKSDVATLSTSKRSPLIAVGMSRGDVFLGELP